MIRKTLLLGALLPIAIAITACSKGASSFFPLDEGMTKTYELQVEMAYQGSKISRSLSLVITNLAPTEISGPSGSTLSAVPVKTELGGSTTFDFVVSDSTGHFSAATQSAGDASPVPKNPPGYHLRTPLAVGTTWETATNTQLQSPNFPGNIPVTLHATIAKVDETVTVPAGTFSDCLRVTATGTGLQEHSHCDGQIQISVNSTDWYCPQIGWVKGLWDEKRINCSTDGSMAAQLTQTGKAPG